METASTSQPHTTAPSPKYGTIDVWIALTGISRRSTYEYLATGHLKAVKAGTRTLINIEKGLAWIDSLPPAKIKQSKQRTSA